MRYIKIKLIILSALFSLCLQAQQKVSDILIKQGIWFLSSSEIIEIADNEQLSQIEYCKKSDVSSIFFDVDKIYTVYSKMGNDVMEDNWKIVDETHLVMVGPDDGSAQLMEILEVNANKLVLQSCNDIDGSITCTKFVYTANKDNWLSDAEVDRLNSTPAKGESIEKAN